MPALVAPLFHVINRYYTNLVRGNTFSHSIVYPSRSPCEPNLDRACSPASIVTRGLRLLCRVLQSQSLIHFELANALFWCIFLSHHFWGAIELFKEKFLEDLQATLTSSPHVINKVLFLILQDWLWRQDHRL